MQQGTFELEETELVQRILAKVDVLVNVGANVGYYCCIGRSLGRHVVAFEPIHNNVKTLLKNLKANNYDVGTEVFPLAMSNKTGILEIYGGGTDASLVKGWGGVPEWYTALVPASTIDTVLGTRFGNRRCFVIVDVEGAEKSMLEGASILLSQMPKPIWMMKISIDSHQPKGVSVNPDLLSTFQVFWERGYEAWTATSQCRLVSSEEVGRIAEGGIDTLNTHNFLFIEKGNKEAVLGGL